MTRAFVAVRPPEGVLDAVAGAVDGLALPGGARRTTRDQWHLTLQFLGNRADVDAVAAVLASPTVPAGAARLGGIGAFPNARRARVVWVGVTEGGDLFTALAREVGERLAPLGHEPEDRPFHAHLTIARLKTPADVRGIVDVESVVGPAWLVDAITLYESRTRPSGAEYSPRAVIRLAGT